MKNFDIILALFFLLIMAPLTCFAQQGVVTAGGEATGLGGTMSFSAGQADFMYFSGEGGSIQFGLQQPFFFDDDEEVIPGERLLTTDDLYHDEDQCFDATQTIVLAQGYDTFMVKEGTGVELIAGNNILMLSGTVVEHGGYLHARITTDGQFCDQETPMVATTPGDHTGNTAQQEPLPSPGREIKEEVFFRVYPNPTKGDFTVELTTRNFLDRPVTIEVIGVRGETLKRITDINHHRHRLSIAGFQPGLYVIRVQSGEDFGIERIIKR